MFEYCDTDLIPYDRALLGKDDVRHFCALLRFEQHLKQLL